MHNERFLKSAKTCAAALSVLALFPALCRGGTADGAFTLSSGEMPVIAIARGMRPFVTRAAEDVAGDIEKIFGVRPRIVTGEPPAENAITLSKAGTGWERYELVSRAGNVLAVTGSDDRGVMFGLYRFASEFLGVDPFYRWSGREPVKTKKKTWERISLKQGSPSFRFRAWFINDEDFLNGLCPEENGRRAIDYPRYHVCFGPSLADRIYETAVRAGFNTVICASYVDILNPDEKRLVDIASSRGLYITMHHQEPVGAGARQIDVHFPEAKGTTYASHPGIWRKAWKRYIGQWAEVPDVIWQIGLRGRGDKPFWMRADEWVSPDVSDAEDRRRAGLISSAMAEQLAMIEKALGRRPRHLATQLWMEGEEYYRKGLLDIPEGTTVVFSDNCPGLKFQSDIGSVKALDPEKSFGLYYHLALLHGNHRCELVPPLRTHQVLGDAYGKGARELVIFNVSNIRPFLYTLEAAGEMTRDIAGFDAARFRDRWSAARFGKRAGAVARAIDLYFAAYETVFSRDTLSSYGSPRERAPLAILHDGILSAGVNGMLGALASTNRAALSPVVSQYVSDPDRLTKIPADLRRRVTQDMFPDFEDRARAGLRARTQSAAFGRCIEQIARASHGLDAAQRRQLFERFGYPARFMRFSSDMYAELASALEAKNAGDEGAERAHLETAYAGAMARDALDKNYNSGKWKRWYDRDLIYPCSHVTGELKKLVSRLPWSVMRLEDGTHIRTAEEWQEKARAQVIRFFEKNVYGEMPPLPAKISFDLVETSDDALGGIAKRRQYRIVSSDKRGTHSFDVLVYLPAGVSKPVPAFVYPNFSGNHTLVDDPGVILYNGYPFWNRPRLRGERKDRVAVRDVISRGFALATFCYGAVYPDYAPSPRDAAPDSIWAVFPESARPEEILAHPTWSWGSMRVRDLLEKLPEIDQKKVAIAGHSRMGKNAIQTGVYDTRFALVCANCGGTKSLKFLPNLRYPYWFSKNLVPYAARYRLKEPMDVMMAQAARFPDPPYDQDAFAACIAPRALFISADTKDESSPPEMSLMLMDKTDNVFKLFGKSVGWYLKEGPHSITHENWHAFMDYARGTLKW